MKPKLKRRAHRKRIRARPTQATSLRGRLNALPPVALTPREAASLVNESIAILMDCSRLIGTKYGFTPVLAATIAEITQVARAFKYARPVYGQIYPGKERVIRWATQRAAHVVKAAKQAFEAHLPPEQLVTSIQVAWTMHAGLPGWSTGHEEACRSFKRRPASYAVRDAAQLVSSLFRVPGSVLDPCGSADIEHAYDLVFNRDAKEENGEVRLLKKSREK